MSRRRLLNEEQAEAAYQDYCKWLQAMFLWRPKRLCNRYGVSRNTLLRYVRERRLRHAA